MDGRNKTRCKLERTYQHDVRGIMGNMSVRNMCMDSVQRGKVE